MSRRYLKSQPIGVFDSGIGGLTVANAINKLLPNEEIVYFGDTAHLPYGDKSVDVIRYYSLRIVKFLIERNCKMIVIACNSASSAASHVLLDFFANQALFVNVIDPLVDAVVAENFNEIGIIATKATTNSKVYQNGFKNKQPELTVSSLATPLLAPMIEEGYFQNRVSEVVIEEYLSNPCFKNIEALLLACTHYPLIKKEIEKFLPEKVKVFDSTFVTANRVKSILEDRNLLNDCKRKEDQFYVSDYTDAFAETTRLFYGQSIHLEAYSIW